ncbi:MAG: peptide-binding protein [Paenibacillaceae bacterium]|nr:peptide-binding protein [Paenibacillaceae bacterium]
MVKDAARWQFFVAPNGSDRNPGTLERPFSTLARARDAVREAKSVGSRPIVVYLRQGTYYLPETFVLGSEDSGMEGCPVVYASYPGEKATVSGGRRLTTEWRPFRDGIFACTLGEADTDIVDFTELFANGRRQIRARYPNGDPTSPLPENFVFLAGADRRKKADEADSAYKNNYTEHPPLPHREVYYETTTFTARHWARPEEAVLHVFPNVNWSTLQFCIRGIDPARNAILLGEGGWQQHEKYASRPGTDLDHTSRYYIDNVFEELDAPREWYFDRKTRTLYYMPPEGFDLNGAIFEVPQLERLVEFRGTTQSPVRHVHWEGVRFAHAVPTYFNAYEIPSFGDWAIVRSGAVFVEGAEDCRIASSFFDAPGGNALFISRYNVRIAVEDCLFTEAGESAIAIVGKSRLNKQKSYTCPYCGNVHPWGFDPPNEHFPRECTIRNNLIHDIGIYGKQTAGLFLSVTADNVIIHNEMYNIPRAAICIHDGTYGGHIIEHNYLHHTCRETDEHGTFNAWGRDSWWCHKQSHGPVDHPAGDVTADAKVTTLLRNNLIWDFKGWGIDLDDGASNYDIYNNVCIGVPIKTREGDLRTVHNNVVVLAAKASAIQVGCVGNRDRWIGNIFTGQKETIQFTQPPDEGKWVEELDRNLYFNDQGQFASGGMDFATWQAQGYDGHSVFADPLFTDPAARNFTVAPDSPALRVGFVNFPMDRFGLLHYPERWRAEDPQLPLYDRAVIDREWIRQARNRRKPVFPDERLVYVLTASNCAESQDVQRQKGEEAAALSNDPDSFVSWELHFAGGGRYVAELVYACDADWAMAEFVLTIEVDSIGQSEIRARTERAEAGSSLRSMRLGECSLGGEQGDSIRITLKPLEGTGGSLMNFREIRLIPAVSK